MPGDLCLFSFTPAISTSRHSIQALRVLLYQSTLPYYISSRLVTLLEVTDAPTQVSDNFDLTVSFKFNNF